MIDAYFHGFRLIKAFSITTEEAVPTSNDDLSQIARLQASRLYTNKKFCECPSSEKGIINIDASAHESSCKYRKRVMSNGYVVETSVLPESEDIDNGLGVAI